LRADEAGPGVERSSAGSAAFRDFDESELPYSAAANSDKPMAASCSAEIS